MLKILLEIFLLLIHGFYCIPPQIKTQSNDRIQGHAGPAHRDQSEAFVKRYILQWQLFLINDMEMSDLVFCSLAKNTLIGHQ